MSARMSWSTHCLSGQRRYLNIDIVNSIDNNSIDNNIAIDIVKSPEKLLEASVFNLCEDH